jgi:hypothetical protein
VLICNSMFVYRHVSQPQLHSSTTWGNYQKYCYLTNSTFLKGAARHKYFFFFFNIPQWFFYAAGIKLYMNCKYCY